MSFYGKKLCTEIVFGQVLELVTDADDCCWVITDDRTPAFPLWQKGMEEMVIPPVMRIIERWRKEDEVNELLGK